MGDLIGCFELKNVLFDKICLSLLKTAIPSNDGDQLNPVAILAKNPNENTSTKFKRI